MPIASPPPGVSGHRSRHEAAGDCYTCARECGIDPDGLVPAHRTRAGRLFSTMFSEVSPVKIHVDVDVTPEELRRFLGLPDVQPVNEELVARMREHVAQGMDPAQIGALVQSMVAGGMQSMDAVQRMMSDLLARGGRDGSKK